MELFTCEASLEELLNVASKLHCMLVQERLSVVLLKGNLGSGKTSLVKEWVKHLGGRNITASPSFSLVHEYNVHFGKLSHLDLYRIENHRELNDLNWDELLETSSIVFVEWPEILLPFLQDDALHIEIRSPHPTVRQYQVSRFSPSTPTQL